MTVITNFDRLMNILVITVIVKRFIFFTYTYDVKILHTPYKNRIYKIFTNYEKLPFEIGDDIDDVLKWCEKNKYDYYQQDVNLNI